MSFNRSVLAGLVITIVLVGLWISRCSGPRADVVGAPIVRAPQAPGEAYHVEVPVRNAGPGHGEVQVTVRLRDPSSGRAYEREETVQLEAGEQVSVVAEIFAPPATYEPQVEVTYPPG